MSRKKMDYMNHKFSKIELFSYDGIQFDGLPVFHFINTVDNHKIFDEKLRYPLYSNEHIIDKKYS